MSWGAPCVSFSPSASSGSSSRQARVPRDHSPGFKTLQGRLTFLPCEVGVSPTPASGLWRPLSESSRRAWRPATSPGVPGHYGGAQLFFGRDVGLLGWVRGAPGLASQGS